MATSIVFGLSFSTLLTLFVIPAGYLVAEDGKRWLGFSGGESS
jgi:multidrug efflux pump subunit AcrB